MKSLLRSLALLAALTTSAWATTPVLKQIDELQNTAGGSVVSVPSVGTDILSNSSTNTLTNKSMAGNTNTFTLIPVGAIGNGSVLSGSNSGDVTAAAFGSSPNSNGFSLTGQALNLQPADATHPGGLLSADWNTFNNKQAGPLTGDVTTSGAAATLATVNSNVGSFTNANVTVNAKGLITAASSGTGSSPTVNGTVASPGSVTAVGGVSLSTPTYQNIAFVKGGTPSATVTVTATPSITACTAAGQELTLVSESATALFTLQNNSDLAGSQLLMNGPWTSGMNSGTPYTITFKCDGAGTPAWVEVSRNN